MAVRNRLVESLSQWRAGAEDAAGWLGERALARRTTRYRQYLGNDVTRDQRYAFGPAFGTFPVDLTESITVPDGGVVLLDVALRSCGLGAVRDPFIEACAATTNRSVRQYVERSVSARRYVNLSELRGLGDVRLRLSDLAITENEARFIVAPKVSVPGPLLVVAPHPDDAELAAFGLYADREDAWVVTVCAGEVGTHDYGGLFPPDAPGALLRGKTRVAESVAAPLLGGVLWERTANLGYFDGSLLAMYQKPHQHVHSTMSGTGDPSVFRSANPHAWLPPRPQAHWSGLVDDLVHVLRLSGARSVVFPHPMLEEHADHSVVGLAMFAALRQSALRPTRILTYAVHTAGGALGSSVHPVGARDGTVTLPPLDDAQPLFDGLCSVELDTDTLRRKALALDTYRDLRDPEGPLPPEQIRTRLRRGLREMYRALTVYDVGLLRRFLRPNELFYVLEADRADVWEARCTRWLHEHLDS